MKLYISNIMKLFLFSTFFAVLLGCKNQDRGSLDFDKEKLDISKENLVGTGFEQVLLDQKTVNKNYVSKITLAPNSYTHWHSHPGGQIIIVTDGEGMYQSKGKDKIRIKKGDVIETMSGLYHWTGSTTNSSLSYITIKTVMNGGIVNWHEEMTKERYLAEKTKAEKS